MVKHVAHVLIALCCGKSVLAEVGGDARRLLSGRKTFSVKDFGAKGDLHDDTQAIQKAFDALKTEKSSELRFPKGKYKFGPVQFSDLKDVKINFEKGAELHIGNKDLMKHYKADAHTPWFAGKNCNGLEISGGIFDGHRESFGKDRHNFFALSHMTDLDMHDMEMWRGSGAHIGIGASSGFHLHHITMNVTDPGSHFTEGVQVGDSTNGRIENVDVFDGDDCLKVHGKSSNIIFENCVCAHGHGLTIGGKEGEMEVKDVKFSHIKLYSMTNGARLKMSPQAKGYVKNITWEHLTMENVAVPIHIQTDYEKDHLGGDNEKVEIGDLYYTDIKATWDEDKPKVGGKGHPCKNGWIKCTKNRECKKLHFKDIKLDVKNPQKNKHGDYRYYQGWVCDGGNEQAEVDNVSPEWPCHSHGPSPGPSPSPSPSPSPKTCKICELDSPHAKCDCQLPGESDRRRRVSNSDGDCQPAGHSGRRRRCPEQKSKWDLEGNSEDDEYSEDDETQEELTV